MRQAVREVDVDGAYAVLAQRAMCDPKDEQPPEAPASDGRCKNGGN
jgi:hypothetical protein